MTPLMSWLTLGAALSPVGIWLYVQLRRSQEHASARIYYLDSAPRRIPARWE